MTLLKKLRKVTTVGANIDAIRDFSLPMLFVHSAWTQYKKLNLTRRIVLNLTIKRVVYHLVL